MERKIPDKDQIVKMLSNVPEHVREMLAEGIIESTKRDLSLSLPPAESLPPVFFLENAFSLLNYQKETCQKALTCDEEDLKYAQDYAEEILSYYKFRYGIDLRGTHLNPGYPDNNISQYITGVEQYINSTLEARKAVFSALNIFDGEAIDPYSCPCALSDPHVASVIANSFLDATETARLLRKTAVTTTL